MAIKYLCIISLITSVIFSSCSNAKTDNVDRINTKVVIHIGKVNITEYEFEKNLNVFKNNFRPQGHQLQNNDIKKWISEFIDHTYFLADAYDKGYDKDKHIDSIVESAGHSLIAQIQPLYGQRNTSNNNIVANMMSAKNLINEHHSKVNVKAHFQFDENNIQALAAKLTNSIYGQQHTFIKKNLSSLLSKKLLAYVAPNGSLKDVTVDDFFNYYNMLVFKYDVNNSNDIHHNLMDIVYDEYEYNNATRSGTTKQAKFILDKNNLKNILIYNKYEANVLVGNKPITNIELMATYNIMKPFFIQATNAIVSVFYFKDRQKALVCSGILRSKQNIADTFKFRGITKAQWHFKINYKSNTLLDTMKKIIFNLKDNYVARPVFLEDNYIVIKRESATGSRIRTPDEIEDQLIKEVKNKRIIINKPIILAGLKNKYILKNNIDYNITAY